ncbi:MAG: OB-fold domain-containing protein [Desulfomonilaceae bacterium]|nr:OB-fold domain-containing protein [Desulfomonilaceae bacterium]
MVGIKSYGVYLPYYRLNRPDISKAWGGFQVPGEKTVANFDEDTLTMAVEACRDCLNGFDRNAVDAVFLSSTTYPYAEKQSSSLVAAVLDLNRTARTIDVAGTLRSGTNAVRLALNAVKSKDASNVLIAASDLRLGLPSGGKELEFGDGAASLLISDTDVVASIDDVYSVNNEMYDVYRLAGERFVRSWEDRFVREAGYGTVVPRAVSEALEAFGRKPEDFAAAVIYAPNPGYLGGVAKKCGFDPKKQAIDPLWGMTGNLGSSHAMVLLAGALEQSKPGDRILWVAYGDGCDVVSLTVTDEIEKIAGKRSVQRMLESKSVTTYQKYLRWRELIAVEPPMRPRTEPASAPALYRDRKCGLALYGSKCTKCGTVQYPVQRICMECRSKDEFEYYAFADKKGKIVTFSHDNLAVSPDPPTTLAAVDFEEGGRIMMDVTDRNPSDIKVGMPLEMTFRKFRQTEGVQVYWWKSRPIR